MAGVADAKNNSVIHISMQHGFLAAIFLSPGPLLLFFLEFFQALRAQAIVIFLQDLHHILLMDPYLFTPAILFPVTGE